MKRIELFFDIVSPYSYLAFETLLKLRPRWNIELELKPFFLGGVMQATGNKPPATNPYKGQYLTKDLARSASAYKIPVEFPSKFPCNTIKAMRVLTHLKAAHPNKLEDCSQRLFHCYFRDSQDMEDAEVLAAVLRKAGFSEGDAKRILEVEVNQKEVKEGLKAVTDQAVELGAFGAPILLVKRNEADQGEMWFGSDRFDQIADYLGVTFDRSKL